MPILFHEKTGKTGKYSKSAIFVWYENGRPRLLGAQSTNTERALIFSNHRLGKFQELIAVQTGVSAAQQKLYFKYEEFKPNTMAPAKEYPKTSVCIPQGSVESIT